VQARVTGTCMAGSSIRAIAADGTVTCEADDDTTYSAGSGLTLSGTTFAVNTSTIQARVSGSCGAGHAIRAIAADGTVTCEVTASSRERGLITGDPSSPTFVTKPSCPSGTSPRLRTYFHSAYEYSPSSSYSYHRFNGVWCTSASSSVWRCAVGYCYSCSFSGTGALNSDGTVDRWPTSWVSWGYGHAIYETFCE